MANKWLTARAELLMKFANGFPNTVDKVTLNIDYPDVGWIDMHFIVNGKEVTVIDTSGVYEPFLPLRRWLEFLITDWFETNASITLDLESNRVTLSYEPILHPGIDGRDRKPYPRNCGIFSIYDNWTDEIILTAYCDNLDFVSMFYRTLLRYAIAHAYNKEFVDDWIYDTYNAEVSEFETDHECSQFFIDLVKSPIIEDFFNNHYQFELKELKSHYRKQIEKELQSHGFVEADLSNDEMMQLIEEIKCVEAGGIVLDGILFFKEIFTEHNQRRFNKEEERKKNDWVKFMKSNRINRIFDENPLGHATHWKTVCDGSEDDILSIILDSTGDIGYGKVNVRGKELRVTAERGSNLWVTGEKIVVAKPDGKCIESAYPSFKYGGTVKGAILKYINEHHNGLEALLTVDISGQEYCFFDLDYIANKDKYQVGNQYDFSLGAFAYNAEVAPAAEQFNPFRCDKYDDEYDFASTVKGTIYHLKLLYTKILRIPISIAKTEGDGQEIIIPLLAKAEMFQQDPTADDLIKGHCWLAGRLIDRK